MLQLDIVNLLCVYQSNGRNNYIQIGSQTI